MQEIIVIFFENRSFVLNGVGLFGATLYLFSYVRLTNGTYSGRERIFLIQNLLAALLVGMSLFVSFNAATAMIQFFWLIATARALLYPKNIPIKFSQVQKDTYIGKKHPYLFH